MAHHRHGSADRSGFLGKTERRQLGAPRQIQLQHQYIFHRVVSDCLFYREHLAIACHGNQTPRFFVIRHVKAGYDNSGLGNQKAPGSRRELDLLGFGVLEELAEDQRSGLRLCSDPRQRELFLPALGEINITEVPLDFESVNERARQ
jgi:hypothetical protein